MIAMSVPVVALIVAAIFFWCRKEKRVKEVSPVVEVPDVEVVAENNVEVPVTPPPQFVPVRVRPQRQPTMEDVKAYLRRVPQVYEEGMANGHANEVSWMQECGLLTAVLNNPARL